MKGARKGYEREEYLEKTRELESTLTQITPLEFTSDNPVNISGECEEKRIYVCSNEMNLFSSFSGFDCRDIKLINYDKPAISISYFNKHKYYLNKKPTTKQIEGLLNDEIEKIEKEIKQLFELRAMNINMDIIEKLTNELLISLDEVKKINKNTDGFQFALSNYYRFYVYSYISYKYFKNGYVETENSHLIKSQSDKERKNIVFIDTEIIKKPVSYDNKKISNFLNSFPKILHCGTVDLFIK